MWRLITYCSLGLRVLASPPDMSIQVLPYLWAKSCKRDCRNLPPNFFTLSQSSFSMNSRPLSDVTQESATKVKPHENSFPSPNLILGSVSPCDLWTATAHANRNGSWVRAIGCDCDWNEFFNGVIGTIGIPLGKPLHGSVRQSVGPLSFGVVKVLLLFTFGTGRATFPPLA